MKKLIRNSTAEFLIFTSQAGEDSIEVRVEDETVWLTQKLIAELFGKGRSTITEHLRNIFSESELVERSVCREFRHTGNDGKSYQTKFYNLDAIISVGYRVNSKRATQFRQWATQVLREFAIKGYVLETNVWKRVFFSAKTILKACWLRSAKSDSASVVSIKKSPIFMSPAWITTKMQRQPKTSFPRFRISFTLAYMAIRRLS